MMPYKYVVLAMPRSMSFWLAEFLKFDHDPRDTPPQSDGLVDTGAYMNKEFYDSIIGPETKVAFLIRDPRLVAESISKNFGLSSLQATMFANHCHSQLLERMESKGVSKLMAVEAPLRSSDVLELMDYFGLDTPHHSDIVIALSEKKDKAYYPGYIAQARHEFSQIFNLPK